MVKTVKIAGTQVNPGGRQAEFAGNCRQWQTHPAAAPRQPPPGDPGEKTVNGNCSGRKLVVNARGKTEQRTNDHGRTMKIAGSIAAERRQQVRRGRTAAVVTNRRQAGSRRHPGGQVQVITQAQNGNLAGIGSRPKRQAEWQVHCETVNGILQNAGTQ